MPAKKTSSKKKTKSNPGIASLEQALARVRENLPSVILIGGNNDFLVGRAWTSLAETVEQSHPDVQMEHWTEGADLARVAESFRTSTLFSSKRLLLVPEVNAFVTARELDTLVEKAVKGWESARTERKRKTSAAQLMHAIGLIGVRLDLPNAEILEALAATTHKKTIAEILEFSRESGGSASRGEGDAAIIGAMVENGGATGTHIALRTGEIPNSSATIDAIDRAGIIIRCDLSRETFNVAFESALDDVASEWEVRFEPAAISTLRELLGIDRILGDKWSKELPDLGLAVSEIRRLAAFAGVGGTVTRSIVAKQIDRREGGARFEVTSLVADGKPIEAVEKLRELVVQAKRDRPATPDEIAFGSFVPMLAEELRVLVAIAAWCRIRGVRSSGGYNRFKASLADQLLDDLEARGLMKRRLHPFPLFKKFETVSSGRYGERALVECLRRLSEIEMERKSGGVPVQIGLETALVALDAR